MRTPALLTRIAIALALVALLPLLFASWQLVSLNRSSMRDQVDRTNILAASTTADQLATQLESWNSLARSIAAHPVVQRADLAALADLLRANLQTWGDLGVLGLAIVDPEGALVVGSRANPNLDLDRIPGLQWQPLQDDPATPPDPGTLVAGVSFSDAIFLRSPIEQAGYVVLVGDRRDLDRPLEIQTFLSTDQAQLFAIDRSGAVVAGTGSPDTLTEDLLTAARSGLVAGSRIFSNPESGDFLAAYAPVGRTPMRVISLQPQETADAVATSMRRRAALIVAFAVGLVGLLLTMTYGAVVQPLRRLLEAQRRLAQLDGDEPQTDEPGGDLIQELEATFSALEERVRDSERLGKVFLGRYQVIELVGRGGMGTVFRGWDPKLERPVALKTVRLGTGELGDSPTEVHEKVRSLLKEAVLVAQLNHPNVVTVYDFEELGGSAFLAMELVDGITLEQLHYFGRMDSDLIAPLGLHLARALEAAHDRGVLHRDIKSPNVLLGRDDSVKVVDFGLAQLTTATQGEDGLIFGTPGYVAPEVIRGDPSDEKVDLFALGVVLYECAAGQMPFHGANIPMILRATVRDDFEPLQSHNGDLDPDIASLIEELLRKEPETRPSAAQARGRLDEICIRLGQHWSLPHIESLEPQKRQHTTRARAQWIQTTSFGTRPSGLLKRS